MALTTPFVDQVAIVTGAAGAIGLAITTRLLAGGASLCLVDRTREGLEKAASSLTSAHSDRVRLCPVDLADDQQIERFCLDVRQSYLSVDALVHCAGTIALDSVQDARVEDFDRQYRVNVRAPFQITKALLPVIARCRGQIVFINSSAALHPVKGAGQYAATKHALLGLANSLREEVNQHGVRVLSVFPGRTASGMQAQVHEREGRPYNPAVLLQPDDVASVIVHALALPMTAEVTDISIRPLKKSY